MATEKFVAMVELAEARKDWRAKRAAWGKAEDRLIKIRAEVNRIALTESLVERLDGGPPVLLDDLPSGTVARWLTALIDGQTTAVETEGASPGSRRSWTAIGSSLWSTTERGRQRPVDFALTDDREGARLARTVRNSGRSGGR